MIPEADAAAIRAFEEARPGSPAAVIVVADGRRGEPARMWRFAGAGIDSARKQARLYASAAIYRKTKSGWESVS